LGLCDNFLTCVFRAWDFSRPVILAPAMNTLMWQSRVTLRHLRQLVEDHGDGTGADGPWSLDDAADVFARYAPNLLCGDVGIGAMAEVAAIAEVVRREANATGPLTQEPPR
jgi:phosphopantothenoylcysteine decarboxylase